MEHRSVLLPKFEDLNQSENCQAADPVPTDTLLTLQQYQIILKGDVLDISQHNDP